MNRLFWLCKIIDLETNLFGNFIGDETSICYLFEYQRMMLYMILTYFISSYLTNQFCINLIKQVKLVTNNSKNIFLQKFVSGDKFGSQSCG